METLLIHSKHVTENDTFIKICKVLNDEGVTINAGPKLKKLLTFGPPLAKSMRIEYSALECTIEAVESVDEAVNHINTYGSSHTDSIVTENGTCFEAKSETIELLTSFEIRLVLYIIRNTFDIFVIFHWYSLLLHVQFENSFSFRLSTYFETHRL